MTTVAALAARLRPITLCTNATSQIFPKYPFRMKSTTSTLLNLSRLASSSRNFHSSQSVSQAPIYETNSRVPLNTFSTHPALLSPQSATVFLIQRQGIRTKSGSDNEIKYAGGIRKFSDNLDRRKDEEEAPKTMLGKFKFLWKKYWYLVLPVHIVTSAAWFGGFYAIAASGADVVGFLEWMNLVPDALILKLKNTPSAANVAVAYLLYKIASPARYAVTVGGTTMLIRLGAKRDYPTASEVGDEMKEMMEKGKHRMRAHSKRRTDQYEHWRKRMGGRRHRIMTYWRNRRKDKKHD